MNPDGKVVVGGRVVVYGTGSIFCKSMRAVQTVKAGSLA